MTKAMPRNPPKHIFSRAVAAWVRSKNLQLLAENALKRERRKANAEADRSTASVDGDAVL